MKVVGIKNVSYDRKSDGRHIEGYEIHFTYPSKNIVGEGCDRAFLSTTVVENAGGVPAVGDEVNFVYNRFGKVAGFEVL